MCLLPVFRWNMLCVPIPLEHTVMFVSGCSGLINTGHSFLGDSGSCRTKIGSVSRSDYVVNLQYMPAISRSTKLWPSSHMVIGMFRLRLWCGLLKQTTHCCLTLKNLNVLFHCCLPHIARFPQVLSGLRDIFASSFFVITWICFVSVSLYVYSYNLWAGFMFFAQSHKLVWSVYAWVNKCRFWGKKIKEILKKKVCIFGNC